MDLFSGLIKGAVDATTSGRRGIEETAAAVTTLFLSGVPAPDATAHLLPHRRVPQAGKRSDARDPSEEWV